jgi:hypothetical protein
LEEKGLTETAKHDISEFLTERRTAHDRTTANPTTIEQRRSVVRNLLDAVGIDRSSLEGLLKNPKADRAKTALRFVERLEAHQTIQSPQFQSRRDVSIL